MVAQTLNGIRLAILATDGFEQSELLEPKKALEAAGAQVDVVSPKDGKIKAWKHKDWGVEVDVDVPLDTAKAKEYQALMLPGGVMNPDSLRMNEKAVQFVKAFVEAKKPIAAICHGPQILIETGFVKGRMITSWPSLKTDLTNAGAHWVDQEVVVDRGLITSRKPDDIPAFSAMMIDEFAMAGQDAAACSERTYPLESGHA